MRGKIILLVEDNNRINEDNRRLLENQDFIVLVAKSLSAARELLVERKPDAIVLDVGMPDGSGLYFLRELRETSKTPVLLLTESGKDKDIELGFKSGCNDYLPKPYSFGVLLARLRNLLKSAEQIPEKVEKGSLTLKTAPMTAYLNGVDLMLSQKEFSLLLLFIQNENHMMSREYLYEQVWGRPMNGDNQALKKVVSRLRSKLINSGFSISADYGEGYHFKQDK